MCFASSFLKRSDLLIKFVVHFHKIAATEFEREKEFLAFVFISDAMKYCEQWLK